MLIKMYGARRETEARIAPPNASAPAQEISGKPDPKHVSTSYVERQNLTMRMHKRRFTRLTNAFSKRIDHHVAAISLHFMYTNFVRIHQTLGDARDGRGRNGSALGDVRYSSFAG